MKQRRFTVTFVTLGILVAFSIGAYYLSKPSESKIPDPSPLSITETTPSPSISPTPSLEPVSKIPIKPTEGWKTASIEGVEFKIPTGARFELSPNYGGNDGRTWGLIYMSSSSVIPDRVSVEEYKGGSRREQFLGENPFDCHYIFEEALFGSINALQIASDGGWCQGGAGGIVTVVGDKLFVYHNLNYDLDSKVIYRFDSRDALISTLR